MSLARSGLRRKRSHCNLARPASDTVGNGKASHVASLHLPKPKFRALGACGELVIGRARSSPRDSRNPFLESVN